MNNSILSVIDARQYGEIRTLEQGLDVLERICLDLDRGGYATIAEQVECVVKGMRHLTDDGEYVRTEDVASRVFRVSGIVREADRAAKKKEIAARAVVRVVERLGVDGSIDYGTLDDMVDDIQEEALDKLEVAILDDVEVALDKAADDIEEGRL